MSATASPRRAVTIADAAVQLGVHRSTIWRMQRDAQIETIKIRGKRLVPVAEIERLLAGGGARSPDDDEPVDPAGDTPDPVGVPVGVPPPARIEKRRLYPRVTR
jgi:excisionase family DNA binding protein